MQQPLGWYVVPLGWYSSWLKSPPGSPLKRDIPDIPNKYSLYGVDCVGYHHFPYDLLFVGIEFTYSAKGPFPTKYVMPKYPNCLSTPPKNHTLSFQVDGPLIFGGLFYKIFIDYDVPLARVQKIESNFQGYHCITVRRPRTPLPMQLEALNGVAANL